MCEHANQTNEFMNHLTLELYPALGQKIHNALNCSFMQGSETPEKQVMADLISDIKNEFHSLITYEKKLVFPSVLKVCEEKKENEKLPNLLDLLQLTRSKEHKLMHHVRRLIILLEVPLWNTREQEELARAFSHDFAAKKLEWYKLIEELVNTCDVFHKNYMEIVKLFNSKGGLTSSPNSVK